MKVRVAVLTAAALAAMFSNGCVVATDPPTPNQSTAAPSEIPAAGKYPYVAEALYLKSDSTQSGLAPTSVIHCSGSLIAKDWVLTAAHCVTNSKDTSIAPAKQVFVEFQQSGKKRTPVGVTKVIRHPGYVPVGKDGQFVHGSVDAALLHLKSRIGTQTGPVKLLPKPPAAGTDVILAGWPCLNFEAKSRLCTKLPDEVQVRRTKVVERAACRAAANEICSSRAGKSVALSADSGGALLVNAPQGPRLGGIIAGASPEFDVSAELPLGWIAAHTGVKPS